MDLGIAGKRALVCAASKGLGRGCAEALAREGVDVTICARTEADVKRAADEIGASAGRRVAWVACDITTPAGRAAALAACPSPDILVTNAGGPPPGDFRDWDRDAWIKALDANMLTPIELIKATVDGMIARKFGRIVNITSGAVKAPIDVLGAVERRAQRPHRVRRRARAQGRAARRHDQQPAAGTVRHGPAAQHDGHARQGAGHSRVRGARRDARREPVAPRRHAREFGAMCAFLCSAHAGFVVGQNILLDGGQYPGTY
jgi:3-oxoacyl-[acyl-carrier protein] reductase